MEESSEITFQIENRMETEDADTRPEAIKIAKRMSVRGGRTTVRRSDGRILMEYSRGKLVSFNYRTPDRR